MRTSDKIFISAFQLVTLYLFMFALILIFGFVVELTGFNDNMGVTFFYSLGFMPAIFLIFYGPIAKYISIFIVMSKRKNLETYINSFIFLGLQIICYFIISILLYLLMSIFKGVLYSFGGSDIYILCLLGFGGLYLVLLAFMYYFLTKIYFSIDSKFISTNKLADSLKRMVR